MLVGNSMTCTGNTTGFNTSGIWIIQPEIAITHSWNFTDNPISTVYSFQAQFGLEKHVGIWTIQPKISIECTARCSKINRSQQSIVFKHYKSGWKKTSEFGKSSGKSASSAAGAVEHIIRFIQMILHKYRDGDRLSAEDEDYVMNRVFRYHPDRKSKVSDQMSQFMVYYNRSFMNECSIQLVFVVVLDDGRRREDLSYKKYLTFT